MSIEELINELRRKRELGHRYLMLQILRKNPPTGENVRVRGLGVGYLMNAGEHPDGTWKYLVQFEVEKVIGKLMKAGHAI